MGYLKLDKSLLDMKLTPNELSVMVHLLEVEDYRLYKNEVEDGWFYKSQTELAKECNIKSAHTFRCTINSLIDKGVLNIDRVNGLTTKFKITLSNINRDTLSDNDMDTLSKNNRDTLSKIDPLHNTNIYKTGHKTMDQERLERKNDSLNNSTSYKESEEQSIQPTVGNDNIESPIHPSLSPFVVSSDNIQPSVGKQKTGKDSNDYYQSIKKKNTGEGESLFKYNNRLIVECIIKIVDKYKLTNKDYDSIYWEYFNTGVSLLEENFGLTEEESKKEMYKRIDSRYNKLKFNYQPAFISN